MSELYFPSHSFILKRRRRIGTSDRWAMSATYSAIPADVQPADRDRTEYFNGRYGQIHTAFLDPGVDIKEGDVLVDSSGNRYAVMGIQRWAGAGLLDHLEVVISLTKEAT